MGLSAALPTSASKFADPKIYMLRSLSVPDSYSSSFSFLTFAFSSGSCQAGVCRLRQEARSWNMCGLLLQRAGKYEICIVCVPQIEHTSRAPCLGVTGSNCNRYLFEYEYCGSPSIASKVSLSPFPAGWRIHPDRMTSYTSGPASCPRALSNRLFLCLQFFS
jgi:hypothetical protein